MKQKVLNKVVNIILWIVIMFTVATMLVYAIVWGGSISNNSKDWSMFATLISGMSMLLFSVANLKIWLYQTQISNETVIKQVRVTEQLHRLKSLEEKLLFVSQIHTSYDSLDNYMKEAYNELMKWKIGIHEAVFSNDETLIMEALGSILKEDELWKQFDIKPSPERSWSDTYSQEYREQQIENQIPIKKLLGFYRDQITNG